MVVLIHGLICFLSDVCKKNMKISTNNLIALNVNPIKHKGTQRSAQSPGPSLLDIRFGKQKSFMKGRVRARLLKVMFVF